MNTNSLEDVTNWHPRMVYVWTHKQILKWIDTYGRWSFYNGKRYTIDTKKIFGNRYEVKFKDIDA